MSDAAFLELLASYEAVLDLADGNMSIARTLAEAHNYGVRPPDGLVNAYLARVDHDAAKLGELRGR